MENIGEQAASPESLLIDNPLAPDLYASEVSGFFIFEGVVHLTLDKARVNHAANPPTINRVVIARLCMPVPGAQRLALGLIDFLKKQGHDPMTLVAKEQGPSH